MTRPPLPPDADALLDAISWFLEMRVMPELGDYDRFQARVTLNLLAQLRREVSLSADHEASEMARIEGLLGPGQGNAEARRAALAHAIRAGRLDWRDPALWAHMRASTEAALEITNPRWLRKEPPKA